jgi:hypothetical protein
MSTSLIFPVSNELADFENSGAPPSSIIPFSNAFPGPRAILVLTPNSNSAILVGSKEAGPLLASYFLIDNPIGSGFSTTKSFGAVMQMLASGNRHMPLLLLHMTQTARRAFDNYGYLLF